MPHADYCPDRFNYERRAARSVRIGNLTLGGNAPIRLQSMTTTDTLDIEGTVAESLRMIEAGCELVRITAPSKREAAALGEIKAALAAAGHGDVPVVADIHFTPNAAEVAADHVEKIRVNPGNYADKKKFEEIEYTDESYAAELERIRTKFTPLVLKCKQLGRAMRIGTNHGSLSDRIMSRFGDTAEGMVESALEFLRICREHDYHDLVISMKSSNPQVMVHAYRLLVVRMNEEGMDYPLHLGVTEAGDGEDGRIKSAVGIGTLLEDGIGDTVRVSLTEAPEAEIPVARKLVERYAQRSKGQALPVDAGDWNPFEYTRRASREVGNIGGKQVPVVVHSLGRGPVTPASLFGCGYRYSVPLDKWNLDEFACDAVYVGDREIPFELPGTLCVLQDAAAWTGAERHIPLFDAAEFEQAELPPVATVFVRARRADCARGAFVDRLKAVQHAVVVLETASDHPMADLRAATWVLNAAGCDAPIVLRRRFDGDDAETFQLHMATDAGGLLLDGMGDGVWLEAERVPLQIRNSTAFGILQATRTRISKTEYISCPSCGRTLFDLQETTAKIRAVTSHLKGIKIGIMGCIVNGPGEMADADYGYVGTGPGVITLYKERDVVQRNVPAEGAVDALIELIRSHGDWVEPVGKDEAGS
jgi:(E)-4-hydroxy-3-methylbut-2-enyl-diphosphate synthase